MYVCVFITCMHRRELAPCKLYGAGELSERLDEETKRGVRADAVTCHILMRN